MAVKNALLAQLDRVTGYEPVGRGFESLAARQAKKTPNKVSFLFYVVKRGSNPFCRCFSVADLSARKTCLK